MWGRRRVGVSSGRGGDGIRGDPPHRSIRKEAAGNHIGEVGMPEGICTVHIGGENAWNEPDGALLGSRRGKQSGGINEEEV